MMLALLLMQAVAPLPVDLTRLAATPVLPTCREATAADETVVCARRFDRYRLTVPTARSPSDRRPGEARTGLDALTPPGRCGIFAGERSCTKREAAEFGYGEGRDPATVLGRLATKLIDPDAF